MYLRVQFITYTYFVFHILLTFTHNIYKYSWSIYTYSCVDTLLGSNPQAVYHKQAKAMDILHGTGDVWGDLCHCNMVLRERGSRCAVWVVALLFSYTRYICHSYNSAAQWIRCLAWIIKFGSNPDRVDKRFILVKSTEQGRYGEVQKSYKPRALKLFTALILLIALK